MDSEIRELVSGPAPALTNCVPVSAASVSPTVNWGWFYLPPERTDHCRVLYKAEASSLLFGVAGDVAPTLQKSFYSQTLKSQANWL